MGSFKKRLIEEEEMGIFQDEQIEEPMKYNMVLKHVPNIDIAYSGGYWQSYEDNEDVVIEENKLSIMRDKFIDWRERNYLGGGNMGLIWVKDRDGKKVGYFSYNGRFWRPKDKQGDN